tara:strand:+ start:778 stop:1566 length:789 start_codon:yes stop_codon:yes gene_type:complete
MIKLRKMKNTLLVMLVVTLGVMLSTTKRVNASCPTAIAIVGDSIVFTYSGGVPDWTVLKKIRYYTSVGSGTSYTTSVAGTNTASTTITVPKPPAVNATTTITEILLRTPTSGGGYQWNHACAFNITLPVDLISFEAEREEDNIKLNWSTASEENNDYFEIQKSYDGEVFTPIGYVDGAGNSNEVLDYSYTDSETNKAYYRLKQLDYDGEFEYSDIVVVKGNRREVMSVRYFTLTGVETLKERGSLIITKYSDGSYTKVMVSQ